MLFVYSCVALLFTGDRLFLLYIFLIEFIIFLIFLYTNIKNIFLKNKKYIYYFHVFLSKKYFKK